MKRKLIDLMNQRTAHLTAAQTALEAGNQDTYTSEMAAATALNPDIQQIQNLLSEQERFAVPAAGNPSEAEDRAAERVETLKNGGKVTFSAAEVISALGIGGSRVQNATTLASGELAEPTKTGTEVRDSFGAPCSILDQVFVQDLSGCASIQEPYAITELTGQGAKVTESAGTARTASDPAFRAAKISPYEVAVTTYLDRNLANLTPVAYEAKIRAMALRALRSKVAGLSFLGDGQATPDMFGIYTAKNTLAEKIYAEFSVAAGSITADTLMDLYFSYGGDEELGGSAGLYLTKADLGAIGALRGTNEKKRLFDIKPNAANPNTGTITDGGYIIPYTLSSKLTSLSKATAGASPIQTMSYGNPKAYELGLFGAYSIRVDESYKAAERLLTIMGDVMVGGNLIVDKSFVVATVPAQE